MGMGTGGTERKRGSTTATYDVVLQTPASSPSPDLTLDDVTSALGAAERPREPTTNVVSSETRGKRNRPRLLMRLFSFA